MTELTTASTAKSADNGSIPRKILAVAESTTAPAPAPTAKSAGVSWLWFDPTPLRGMNSGKLTSPQSGRAGLLTGAFGSVD